MRKKILTLGLALGLFVTGAAGVAADHSDYPECDETNWRETGVYPTNGPCVVHDDDTDEDEPIR